MSGSRSWSKLALLLVIVLAVVIMAAALALKPLVFAIAAIAAISYALHRVGRFREPTPSEWIAERIDDLGLVLYGIVVLVEIAIIWLQYA